MTNGRLMRPLAWIARAAEAAPSIRAELADPAPIVSAAVACSAAVAFTAAVACSAAVAFTAAFSAVPAVILVPASYIPVLLAVLAPGRLRVVVARPGVAVEVPQTVVAESLTRGRPGARVARLGRDYEPDA
jgi:hypothetical protein